MKAVVRNGVESLNTLTELQEFREAADLIRNNLIGGENEGREFSKNVDDIYQQMLTIIYHNYANPDKDVDTQTDRIIDIKMLKDLLKTYPELKDSITNILTSEMIKKGNVKKEDIDEIKRIVGDQKSFTLKSFDFAPKSQIFKPYKFNKIEKLEDYENLVPPNSVTSKF